LTIAGARYETMKATLDTLMAAPEFDLVLAVIGSPPRAPPGTAGRPLTGSARPARPRPALIAPRGPDAIARPRRARVPNCRLPEACAAAIAAALSRQPARPLPAHPATPAASSGPILDELAAGALLDRLGIGRAPSVALEVGIAEAPPLPFAYPVAV